MQLTQYIVLNSDEVDVLQQIMTTANGLDVFESFEAISPDELIRFIEKNGKLITLINLFNSLVTKLRKTTNTNEIDGSQETQTLDWLSKL